MVNFLDPFCLVSFYFFFSCAGNCAVLHRLYIYIWKGLIHHPKSIQERPIDIVWREKERSSLLLRRCCSAKDIYIIHTKVCSYIAGKNKKKKKNWKSITQSRPFSCLFLYIILSDGYIFRELHGSISFCMLYPFIFDTLFIFEMIDNLMA